MKQLPFITSAKSIYSSRNYYLRRVSKCQNLNLHPLATARTIYIHLWNPSKAFKKKKKKKIGAVLCSPVWPTVWCCDWAAALWPLPRWSRGFDQSAGRRSRPAWLSAAAPSEPRVCGWRQCMTPVSFFFFLWLTRIYSKHGRHLVFAAEICRCEPGPQDMHIWSQVFTGSAFR